MQMLCRNRVRDYAHWRAIFDSHAQAHRAAGLTLQFMWRDHRDSNNIFFLFQVEDVARAEAFIGAPDAPEIGRAAGVLDGEIHFVEELRGY